VKKQHWAIVWGAVGTLVAVKLGVLRRFGFA